MRPQREFTEVFRRERNYLPYRHSAITTMAIPYRTQRQGTPTVPSGAVRLRLKPAIEYGHRLLSHLDRTSSEKSHS